MNRTTYGLDIAKNVMQLHWVEIETGEIGRKKARVGHLSKRGDPYLRTLLVHGARAVIEHAKDKPKWLEQLLARRPLNVAVAALANKMARTAWALVAHGREYQREWKSTAPTGCTAQAAAA